jgi:hypothetical protein
VFHCRVSGQVVRQFPEQARPHFRTRSVRDSKKELLHFATLKLDQAGGVHVIPPA